MIRHAIVLAAGFGSRLAAEEGHKVLARLGKRSLLEYHVLGFAHAGVERLTVVTGYRSELLAEQISSLSLPIDVDVAHNPAFEKSNGYSVIAGWKDEPAWLTMGDHLFEPSLYDRLPSVETETIGPGVDGLLVIDRKIPSIYDLPDATKLKLDATGNMASIGKEIDPFDVVDCGLFFVSPKFIDALKTAGDQTGDCSTSDAVKTLTSNGTFRLWDLEELLWQDVDTPGARENADGLLRKWKIL